MNSCITIFLCIRQHFLKPESWNTECLKKGGEEVSYFSLKYKLYDLVDWANISKLEIFYKKCLHFIFSRDIISASKNNYIHTAKVYEFRNNRETPNDCNVFDEITAEKPFEVSTA